jgi:hypothetical protein
MPVGHGHRIRQSVAMRSRRGSRRGRFYEYLLGLVGLPAHYRHYAENAAENGSRKVQRSAGQNQIHA